MHFRKLKYNIPNFINIKYIKVVVIKLYSIFKVSINLIIIR